MAACLGVSLTRLRFFLGIPPGSVVYPGASTSSYIYLPFNASISGAACWA